MTPELSSGEEHARAFDSAKRVLCCISKDDIPEVEAVIRLLMPSLDSFWQRLIAESMALIEAELDSFEDELATPSIDALSIAASDKRKKLEQDLILALFLILDRRIAQPISDAGTALVQRAVQTLMSDGAKSIGEPLDLTRAPLLAQAAVQDLLTLIRGRVTIRRPEIEQLLGAFLTTRGPRTPAASGLAGAAQRAAGGGLQTREGWRAELAELLGQATASWLPFVVDQWAYRWFNVGSFTAARQSGAIGLRAVATKDNRTSAFCLWVNGRVVSIERAQGQIDRHVAAALAGDVQALMANWPLLTFRASDGPAEFALAFERVGLPPYHARCRTRVVLVRFR